MKERILKGKNHTSHIPLHTSKGITLIALVITIIVMLILAAVSITMAVNGGLFGYAQNASEETKRARDKEMELGTLEDNLTYENLITKYAIIYGDVNLDGRVNAYDRTAIARYLSGPENSSYLELNEHALLNADVNLDGVVDSTDRELIARSLLPEDNELYVTLPYTGE